MAMASPTSVRYGNRQIPVIGEKKVRGRVYRVLEDVGRAGRKRYWVHDPKAGPGGDFRQILVLPRGKTSRQHLAVLQRLSQGNPNLPTILDSILQRDEIWVVTNWVRGLDLRAYLNDVVARAQKWPSPLEVIKLYRGLAHGLCQMHHRRRIVHGDIRPENLVLAHEPNRLVMIDFGSAWMAEKTTRREPGDGTSRFYVAPEQLDDPQRPKDEIAVPDARSDQFSATAVAYEMLTGVRPYGEIGGEAGLRQNCATYQPLYRPPSQRSPMRRQIPRRIWRAVDDVIGRGLKLDASQRFPSRRPWLEALDDLYCEMRRKGRFNRLESTLLRWIGWIGDKVDRTNVR
jgi:serine/threonine protein kinase